MELTQSLPCPICGNEKMAPIFYGYPSPKWIDMAREEKIALGGLTDHGYTHYCYSCNETYPQTEWNFA